MAGSAEGCGMKSRGGGGAIQPASRVRGAARREVQWSHVLSLARRRQTHYSRLAAGRPAMKRARVSLGTAVVRAPARQVAQPKDSHFPRPKSREAQPAELQGRFRRGSGELHVRFT